MELRFVIRTLTNRCMWCTSYLEIPGCGNGIHINSIPLKWRNIPHAAWISEPEILDQR